MLDIRRVGSSPKAEWTAGVEAKIPTRPAAYGKMLHRHRPFRRSPFTMTQSRDGPER